ncbi:MAG: AraC family transcriptional regulator [Trinickia sp.]|jgi:AraC-like DNA-binding protein|uniref:AraC family transcriptional regulator n=1 Tax=Trinickia sp. TaxID=2571163 RepID=UPI003F7D0AA2
MTSREDRVKEKLSCVHAMSEAHPPLIAVAGRQSVARESGPHRHAAGQLLGLFSGLMTVRTERGAWVLPTMRAVWIPPSHIHAARSHGPFAGWAAYIAPAECSALPDQPRVIDVSGLLREAVLTATEWGLDPFKASQRNVFAVILDEIAGSCADAFRLPMPSDARLLRIASALIDEPADSRTLEAWAKLAHAAPRTLSRRFVEETGLTFTAWRQGARLMRALERLAAGEPVTSIALELGYDNPSAFIALFKRTFGTTPGRYLAPDVPQFWRP